VVASRAGTRCLAPRGRHGQLSVVSLEKEHVKHGRAQRKVSCVLEKSMIASENGPWFH